MKNNDLNFVTWEMRVSEGDPKSVASQEIPDFNYAEYARSLGLIGFSVKEESDIPHILKSALAAERPVLISVDSDPNIPPIPPHLELKKAASFASSLAKGEPEGTKPLLGAISQMWHNMFP